MCVKVYTALSFIRLLSYLRTVALMGFGFSSHPWHSNPRLVFFKSTISRDEKTLTFTAVRRSCHTTICLSDIRSKIIWVELLILKQRLRDMVTVCLSSNLCFCSDLCVHST